MNYITIYRSVRATSRDAVMYAVMIGIFGSIAFDAWYQHQKPIEYIAVAQAQEPEIVLIEVDYSAMSSERIEEIILEKLPPIFVKIAKCEGSKDGKTILPIVEGPTEDHGPLQIHIPTHRERIEELGLDVVNNPYDNVAFAQMLYEESGLRPWEASRKCWSK